MIIKICQIKKLPVIFHSIIVLLVLTAGLMLPAPVMADGVICTVGVGVGISNITILNISYSSVSICWNTGTPATTSFYYDTSMHDSAADYGRHTDELTNLTINHRVDLNGLSAGTTYHYRVGSAATINGITLTDISDDLIFTTEQVPWGGGGGGGQTPTVSGVGKVTWYTSFAGITSSNVEIKSPDGLAKVSVIQGTRVADGRGQALDYMSCYPPVTPAPIPAGKTALGVYDFGPAGATFNPAATITVFYESAKIPENVTEATLKLVYYDDSTSKWVELNNITVDTVNKVISGKTAHFTQFAVFSSAGPKPPLSLGATDLSDSIDSSGKFVATVVVKLDEKLTVKAVINPTITITKGTLGLDNSGQPFSQITITEMTSITDQPEGQIIIGLPYDFGPEGATFEPAVTLKVSYDPSKLPEGLNQQDLTIAHYNAVSKKWFGLPSKVDTVGHIITAPVSYFTTFAVLGKLTTVAPASFKLGSLIMSAIEVMPKEEVEVSTSVSNIGGQAGMYRLTFTVNNVIEGIKDLNLTAGDSEKVTFTINKSEPGVYHIDVNGLTAIFSIKAPATAPTEQPVIPMFAFIIAGVTIVAITIAVLFWIRRRRYFI